MPQPPMRPCRVTVYISSRGPSEGIPVYKTFDLKYWPEETETSEYGLINLVGELMNGKQWEIYTTGPVIIEEL